MLAPLPPVLLVLVLFVGATATAQPRRAGCEAGPRRIELNAEPTAEVPELCIAAGVSTTLVFEGAELLPEGVSLEGRERFTRVEVSATLLRLVPSERVVPGERFKLTVPFKDGAAPTGAAFWLAVHPGQAEPWVEVYRQKRTVESCQQEVRERQAQLRRCREDNARLQAESASPGGLTGLLATGLMDERGVTVKELLESVEFAPTNALPVDGAKSYRSALGVAVELLLRTSEAVPAWRATEAELVGPARRTLRHLRLWQGEPSEGWLRVVVEAAATREEAQGRFTLTVWNEARTRSIVVNGVTFP